MFQIFSENRLLIEGIYSAAVMVLALFIYMKTKKIYDLTSHKGISFFRNAFLYFSLAFFARIMNILASPLLTGGMVAMAFTVLFYYFLTMAGFSLVYSLVWKNLDEIKDFLLMPLALVIALLSVYNEAIFFIIQIIILVYAIILSYSNYQEERNAKKHGFRQLYFIGLILAFIGYLANFASVFIVSFFPEIDLYAYAVTVCVFLLFSYGVMAATKDAK
jgi:hypothetical protein